MDYTQLHTQRNLPPIPVKRLTISMPAYVYDRLMQLPKGTVSQFVTEGIQEKLTYEQIENKKLQTPQGTENNAIEAFEKLLELSKNDPLPDIPWPEMKKLMRKGLA